jgi:hypothetical protein
MTQRDASLQKVSMRVRARGGGLRKTTSLESMRHVDEVAGAAELQDVTRRAWRVNAAQFYFGVCDVCAATRDAAGAPLLVARQPRRTQRECLDCYTSRTTRPRRRRRAEAVAA